GWQGAFGLHAAPGVQPGPQARDLPGVKQGHLDPPSLSEKCESNEHFFWRSESTARTASRNYQQSRRWWPTDHWAQQMKPKEELRNYLVSACALLSPSWSAYPQPSERPWQGQLAAPLPPDTFPRFPGCTYCAPPGEKST